MENEDAFSYSDTNERAKAVQLALEKVREKAFPVQIQIDPKVFASLGSKWEQTAISLLTDLLNKNSHETVGRLLAFTIRLRWFAAYRLAYYEVEMGQPDTTDMPSQFSRLINYGGMSQVLDGYVFDSTSGEEVTALLIECGLDTRPTNIDIFNYDALLHLVDAAKALDSGETLQALNDLHETHILQTKAHGLYGFNVLLASVQRNALPKKGGRARAIQYVPARHFVLTEWDKHKCEYGFNRTAFARDYSKRVKNEFNKIVTERQIAEVWLKKLR